MSNAVMWHLFHFMDTGRSGRAAPAVGCLWSSFTGKSRQRQSGGAVSMANMRLMGTALGIFTLACIAARAQSQDAHEDLTPCPGSAPEPTHTAAWPVAFCNRTGHDVVLEFRDNECPAEDWSRRGDVYQRTLRRGESKIFP